MSLEDLIRMAATKGQLNHLSIISTVKNGFAASYRTSTSGSHAFAQDADPVKALIAALKDGLESTKQRRAPRTEKPNSKESAADSNDMEDFG